MMAIGIAADPTVALEAMLYRLRVVDRPGCFAANSCAAQRFIGPLYGPAATQLLRCLHDLCTPGSPNGIAVGLCEVAARVGLGLSAADRAMRRLERFGAITVHSSRDGIGVGIASRLDPPSATWRRSHYPPGLAEEFQEFLAVGDNRTCRCQV